MSRRGKFAVLASVLAIAGGATTGVLLLRSSGGHSAAPAPRPPSTSELIDRLLRSPVPRIRKDAARRLADRLDPALARRVVASAAPTPRGRLAVGLLRNRYVAVYRSSPTDPVRRTRAIRALTVIGDPTAAGAVAKALADDVNAVVRRAAIAALGRMKRSAPAVVGRLVVARDRTSGPKPDIERALVVIGASAVGPLLQLLPGTVWAEDVISRIGRPALPLLRRRLAQGNFHLKVGASAGLIAVGKRRPGLVRSDIGRIVALMMQRLGTVSVDLEAVDTLARVGKPALDVLLPLARKSYFQLQGIEKKQSESVIFALTRMAKLNPRATAGLLAALKGHDYDLLGDLHEFYIQLGRPGSEGVLIQALDANGDTLMALDFLNSGNAKLDRGARDWAARHGYTVTTQPGQGPPPSWGSADQL